MYVNINIIQLAGTFAAQSQNKSVTQVVHSNY